MFLLLRNMEWNMQPQMVFPLNFSCYSLLSTWATKWENLSVKPKIVVTFFTESIVTS
jgi:hypothetical protein